MQDYYKLLGVGPKSTFSQIKAAYRQQAMKHHPDRGGSHAEMVRINEAWEVLSNPRLRKQYDQQQQSGNASEAAFEKARQRSTRYERDWRKFDSWLSSISRDFDSAKFASRKVFGMEMPTASKSISAWCFIIVGGATGLLVWLALFVSIDSAWTPQNKSTAWSNSPLPGISKQENLLSKPFLPQILMLTCVASVGGGAWAGKWAHQKFGARINGWLPSKAPFSFFTKAPAALEGRRDQHRDKQPPKQKKSSTECPSCGQRLRAPSSSKTLTITCPKCRTRFDFPNQTNQQERSKMNFPPNKTSLATLLRCLLIFEIVFAVIVLPIGIFVASMGEQILTEAGLVSPEFSLVAGALFIVAVVILLPVTIASWVGLFQHRNWARWLYLVNLAAGHLLGIFVSCFTWTYSWDLVSALASIACLSSGIIVSICFLSPLASEFVELGSDDTA